MEQNIVQDLPKAIISWYKFEKGKKALFITGTLPEFEVLFSVLEDKGLEVTCIHKYQLTDFDLEYITPEIPPEYAGVDLNNYQHYFDYIILAGLLEQVVDAQTLIKKLPELMAPQCKILIATNNRFALRHFCGDKDITTGHVLDGIDNYLNLSQKRLETIGGHAFSKVDVERMLKNAGIKKIETYSVFPCIARPQIFLKYGYKPNERLDVRIFAEYVSPETIYLPEERLYQDFLENDLLHQMANGYFIEATIDGTLDNPNQVTVQNDRSEDTAVATFLYEDRVEKIPMYQAGAFKSSQLMANTDDLTEHNVPMVQGKLNVMDNSFVTGFVHGTIYTEYLRDCLRESKEKFLQEMTAFKNIIDNSSEQVPYEEYDWLKFDPYWYKQKPDNPTRYKWRDLAFGSDEDRANLGVILKRGYIDLVSINCFHTERGPVFFDQEFYIEEFPANSIFIRTVDFVYRDCWEMEQLLPKDEVLEYFHLKEHEAMFRKIQYKFLAELRHEAELANYNIRTRKDHGVMNKNRFRMDFAQNEYDRLFENIFKDVESKQIYLFGSGDFAKKFIDQFGKFYEIKGILDNNSEKWGTMLYDIPINSPEIVKEETLPYRVFICIKYYEDVLSQLKKMEVRDISIYDPRIEYPRPLKFKAQGDNGPKPYHVGYVSGVFDMFHIGHLNLLRRSKELCDYLIVGVVTDEQVMNGKKTKPMIPFDQRLAIIEGCKYVDEAVEIPVDKPSSIDAFNMYHFDVQFSGSDYANDKGWLINQDWLRKHGSDIYFFPYTEGISSTAIKTELREQGKNE
ncbi:adenylyltransferase/cytidyltransferase family protein [Pseudobutyrivibrio sp.]|uniref:adenylyltransferase/cytidyltransferase family protein n=1 Tax=Pseudobutyrivibrio sp. TaxID=2014367 RepID=UPI0025DB4AD6|nr:adenylyltransferase/cytidyltransferase family protein [Pseudobutyrivibrio sp.]